MAASGNVGVRKWQSVAIPSGNCRPQLWETRLVFKCGQKVSRDSVQYCQDSEVGTASGLLRHYLSLYYHFLAKLWTDHCTAVVIIAMLVWSCNSRLLCGLEAGVCKCDLREADLILASCHLLISRPLIGHQPRILRCYWPMSSSKEGRNETVTTVSCCRHSLKIQTY